MHTFSSIYRRFLVDLIILGILLGTSPLSSSFSQEWLLFVEIQIPEGKVKKKISFRPSPNLTNGWLASLRLRLLQLLYAGIVLIQRLEILLLLFRQTPSCPHRASCCLCPILQDFLKNDPLVKRYQHLFPVFDFSFLPSLPPSSIPLQAFLKAYIVMVDQKIQTFTRLRQFLIDHPALSLFIGFQPNKEGLLPCPSNINLEHIIPSDRYLREKIQWMDHLFFKTLLSQTVQRIKKLELLDGKVACDVKEIWAYVQQNNPKQFVKDRWNKDLIPSGNPDARLGAKPSSNKDAQGKPLPRLFWGFKSGVFAAPSRLGLVILAESTQQADTGDVSFFVPLLKDFLAYRLKASIFLADAAFDAWYVYRDIANQGGKAYIPLNSRGHDTLEHYYSTNGKLLCPAGLEMKSGGTWFDKQKAHHRKKWICPQKGHAQACPHSDGNPNGCTRIINLDDHHRFELDRSSAHFKKLYKTRTVAERAFSIFDNYGRKVTYQRNLNTLSNLNTLTYAVMNAHVILKANSMPVPT